MKFDNSRSLYERACKTTPGGIHSNVRKNWHPLPLFYDRGKGSRLWDVDGNEFIDYVLARGPLLLGHSPRQVIDAVKAQMDRGLMYAGQHALEIDAAEKIVDLVPCAEAVRFSNSGSEAVHAALRLARAVTGRNKVIRFEGQYHGWFDSAFWSYAPPLDQAGPRENPHPIPVTKGQVPSDSENLLIRPWNDLALIERTFHDHPGQIAAVLTEPIMCNMGGILPEPGFLDGLRDLCTKHGALLIFDEVITGFRVSIGGAQEFFEVVPDLATFAKAMAGGFPVSAIAGRQRFMQAFGDLSVTHAGTYNSNGPCMAATVAALEMLSADDAALLKHAHTMGSQLMNGIADLGRKAGAQIHVRGVPPAFHVSFGETEQVVDYRTFQSRDKQAYSRFWVSLQQQGVRTTPDGLWFVSTAHTQEDVDATLDAVAAALREV
jgi:glutamate-1-semialdehyde 2,1-aminomutase